VAEQRKEEVQQAAAKERERLRQKLKEDAARWNLEQLQLREQLQRREKARKKLEERQREAKRESEEREREVARVCQKFRLEYQAAVMEYIHQMGVKAAAARTPPKEKRKYGTHNRPQNKYKEYSASAKGKARSQEYQRSETAREKTRKRVAELRKREEKAAEKTREKKRKGMAELRKRRKKEKAAAEKVKTTAIAKK